MLITWDNETSNAYDAVAQYIGEHFGWHRDYIARIKTSNLGTSNEYLAPVDCYGEDFEFENDWYEGGEVELLGVIAVEDVYVPPLKEEGKQCQQCGGMK